MPFLVSYSLCRRCRRSRRLPGRSRIEGYPERLEESRPQSFRHFAVGDQRGGFAVRLLQTFRNCSPGAEAVPFASLSSHRHSQLSCLRQCRSSALTLPQSTSTEVLSRSDTQSDRLARGSSSLSSTVSKNLATTVARPSAMEGEELARSSSRSCKRAKIASFVVHPQSQFHSDRIARSRMRDRHSC